MRYDLERGDVEAGFGERLAQQSLRSSGVVVEEEHLPRHPLTVRQHRYRAGSVWHMRPMYIVLVWLVVAAHFAFLIYLPAGGFLALRWRRTIWLHTCVRKEQPVQ